jgi:CheY-like chemotaxis protein
MKRDLHHILLIDDDPAQQFFSGRALDKALSIHRSTVHVVSSGNEAIAYMIGEGRFADRERFPFPTIVITDLNMPDGDGLNVLEFMRSNEQWGVVPRIMFSSSGEDDDVRTAYLLGASAYHIKVAGSDLDACMRRIVDYWTSCEVPPVDRDGRLRVTENLGGPAARYEQPDGGKRMQRPNEPGADDSTSSEVPAKVHEVHR